MKMKHGGRAIGRGGKDLIILGKVLWKKKKNSTYNIYSVIVKTGSLNTYTQACIHTDTWE